jgi:hypothetical protein
MSRGRNHYLSCLGEDASLAYFVKAFVPWRRYFTVRIVNDRVAQLRYPRKMTIAGETRGHFMARKGPAGRKNAIEFLALY